MARTKEDIFESLLGEKDANPVLAAILTSNSKASFYQSLFALYAEVTGDLELTFDDFKEQIDDLLESKQVQTQSWWRTASLGFQLGDALVRNSNGNLGYAQVNEDIQIIKRAAILLVQSGGIQLKVAKIDVDGITPIPLSSSEKNSFEGYVSDIGVAGIEPTVVSENGDEVRIGLNITVDAQIINPDNGTLISDGTTKPVENAIFDYFASFQNDSFGGTFFGNSQLAAILDVKGVINTTYVNLDKKASNEGSFVDVLTLTGKKFETFSGYVRIADAWDLSANLNYTAG